ncbi:hypothetical protein N7457_001488 [Penicillium paradoxum]|uniref:uncharacterized protein n=1 Tax=Penicillium paradoxum TaxID=176176 RepID=UPI002546A84C|nr:uncharacterized protein N7457_001488 [Penicillium paradoxum]KAJ5794889.1 hypothetical protein N7457_001488 [Penicillium paradoxum]
MLPALPLKSPQPSMKPGQQQTPNQLRLGFRLIIPSYPFPTQQPTSTPLWRVPRQRESLTSTYTKPIYTLQPQRYHNKAQNPTHNPNPKPYSPSGAQQQMHTSQNPHVAHVTYSQPNAKLQATRKRTPVLGTRSPCADDLDAGFVSCLHVMLLLSLSLRS